MKIILIHKAELEFSPPVISVIMNLIDLGVEVVLIDTGVNAYWHKVLSQNNVKIFVVQDRGNSLLGKFVSYYLFRKKTYKIIRNIFPNNDDGLLWIEGAYTLVALGNKIKSYHYVLQIQELHNELHYQLKAIRKVIHHAQTVFMPEYNRTVLYQVWFNLIKRPIVLPNKPYFLPTRDELLRLEVKYSNLITLFKNFKIILYQGHISRDRDLSSYVSAIRNLGSDYKLVLLGLDHGMLDSYFKIDPEIIHIDYVPAPDYLLFTSLSYIGLLSYSPVSENNIFCAPNKIYEYSAYGLPIIGNDIPGLYYPIKINHFGEVVDDADPCAIKKAILKINQNYSIYSKNSKQFYEEYNNKEIIKSRLFEL